MKALPCLSRRSFLLAGTSATVVLAVGCAGISFREGTALKVVEYPRKRIASLKGIQAHEPIHFSYPEEGAAYDSFLVQLDGAAAGGVGVDDSIVAFNGTCTHMGGPLSGQYRSEHAVVGPCPLHLTTFDLRKHGMVVSGHGTETLPQVKLETENGEIYATAVMGLIYGLDRNTVLERD
ncbi:MAG: arsenate reductase (azurin) small subunit [bacterium]|nr:arsenate reductase (azurin) small subunit [bacterium]